MQLRPSNKLIGFRVDASIQIGTGHVMRCLTLADALREHGVQSLFFCRTHAGHLIDLIEQRGYDVSVLPALTGEYVLAADAPAHAPWLGTNWAMDAAATCDGLGQVFLDWMVVDHYALDWHWERAMRPRCRRLMVIDDLADRPHDCDLLLDQNLGRSKGDYEDLLPPYTKRLIGPHYALLRAEFAQWRPFSLARRVNAQLQNLLITMGGVDKDNATGRVLKALQTSPLPRDLKITVVMGPHAPWLKNVCDQSAQLPWPTQVLVGIRNMAELMANSDLAIGAAGSTSWERCCLGLPTIQMVLADNQQAIADALAHSGATLTADASNLPAVLSTVGLVAPFQSLETMSNAAAQHTTGRGALKVAAYLIALHHENHIALH